RKYYPNPYGNTRCVVHLADISVGEHRTGHQIPQEIGKAEHRQPQEKEFGQTSFLRLQKNKSDDKSLHQARQRPSERNGNLLRGRDMPGGTVLHKIMVKDRLTPQQRTSEGMSQLVKNCSKKKS